jgi:hypothetical protein
MEAGNESQEKSSEPWREYVYEQHHAGYLHGNLVASSPDRPATVRRIDAQFTERKAKERLSLDCRGSSASMSTRCTGDNASP